MRRARLIVLILGIVFTTSSCSAQPDVGDTGHEARCDGLDSGTAPGVQDGSGAGEMASTLDLAIDDPDEKMRRAAGRMPPIIPADAKYVATTGNDSGPGTESEPWRNILPSFQKLNPGETLIIRGGTYTAIGNSASCGNGRSPFGLVGILGSAESWTTIMGYPGERPRLYHSEGWQTLYICNSSYVRISHLEVYGDANVGNTAPASGVYIFGSHHVEVNDVWSHDNGGCGICSSASNHLAFHGNRVWGNAHWNRFQTSGLSIHRASNIGGGDNPDGYSNYITGNLVWNNYEDDSLGVDQVWGVTDGNGIIIDANNESDAKGRTLIENNILVDNGGPGIMITRSHAVDVIHNTLYQNVRTRVPTVVNNGEIGCNKGFDFKVEGNIVVPRTDNPNLFQDFRCRNHSFADNAWVKTNAPSHGPGDIVLPTGSRVLSDPRLHAPAGCWAAIGQAAGFGAQMPMIEP